MHKGEVRKARTEGGAPTSTMSEHRREREHRHFERNKPGRMQERMRHHGYRLR